MRRDLREVWGLTLEDLDVFLLSEEDLGGSTFGDAVDIIYYDAVQVPFVRLLANPEKYDGKAVDTIAVYGLGALFLDEASYEQRIVPNGIAVGSDYNREPYKKSDPVLSESVGVAPVKELLGRYVRIRGVFEHRRIHDLWESHIHHVAPIWNGEISRKSREAVPVIQQSRSQQPAVLQ